MGAPSVAGGIEERKHRLRTRSRRLRAGLPSVARAEADAAIEERVCALAAFAAADVVLSYLDIGAEVRTRGIIERAWAQGKRVALPWCVPGTRNLRWFCVSSFEALVRSPLGIEEPVPSEAAELVPQACARAVALVPGLAFDVAGRRLGYGGGFYDTFLATFGGVSVGLCREAQLVESLQALGVVEPHDLPVQVVVTERRTLWPAQAEGGTQGTRQG